MVVGTAKKNEKLNLCLKHASSFSSTQTFPSFQLAFKEHIAISHTSNFLSEALERFRIWM